MNATTPPIDTFPLLLYLLKSYIAMDYLCMFNQCIFPVFLLFAISLVVQYTMLYNAI